jgi:hypothetical protein
MREYYGGNRYIGEGYGPSCVLLFFSKEYTELEPQEAEPHDAVHARSRTDGRTYRPQGSPVPHAVCTMNRVTDRAHVKFQARGGAYGSLAR